MFQIIWSSVESGHKKNWLFGEKWVERRKVIRNSPDLMVLDTTEKTLNIKCAETSQMLRTEFGRY